MTVRPASAAIIAAARPWFAEAWSEMRGPAERGGAEAPTVDRWLAHEAQPVTRAFITLDGLPIGLLSFAIERQRVLIDELAVIPAYRDRGFGAEAVYWLEQMCGATEAEARVPLSNGLAIYFWLRVGYRPLFCARHGQPGFSVMVRDLAAAANDPGEASSVAR